MEGFILNSKDLIVVGGGPGGYVAAIKGAKLGMNVLLVEKDRLGGTCLNHGCIPTKTYYHDAQTVKQYNDLKNANIFESSKPIYNMQQGYERKQSIVNKLVGGIEQLIKGNEIEVIYGQANISKPGCVQIQDQDYYSDNIIIATGSVDSIPPIDIEDSSNVLDVKKILDLTEIPKELTIIGGGVIGIEFACIFNQLGSKVTVIEFAPNILGNIDSDISKRMKVFLKKQGITLYTKAMAKSINKDGNKSSVIFDDGKQEKQIVADKVLIATGRIACLDGMDIQKLGLETEKGFIAVDENYQTNVNGIYAIGDVIGGKMLAHVASYQGKAVVDKILGKDVSLNMKAVPACVFSFPEIATVGMTQDQAKQEGIEIKVGRANYAANGKAMTICETDGFVKVVSDMSGKIIGVHIMGAHADDLILEAAILVEKGINVDNVDYCIHPHPTLGEVLSEAIEDVNNNAIHIVYKK